MSRYMMIPVLMLFCSFPLPAQQDLSGSTDKPLRIEIRVESDNETYKIIPCGEAGMILFYRSVELTENNESRWYFSFYDQNLRHLWIKSVPVVASLNFREARLTNDTLACFFESEKKSKQQDVNFQILRIDLHTGKMILNNGKIAESATITGFWIYRQIAFITLQQDQRSALLLTMHLPTGKVTNTTLYEGEDPEVLALSLDTLHAFASVLLSHKTTKTAAEILRIGIDFAGNRVSETKIGDFGSTHILTNLQEYDMTENQTLLAGAYSQSSGSRREPQVHTTGLFTARLEGEILRNLRFVNFLDLQNIRNLMGEKEILDLRKKSIKKRAADQTYSLDFSLVMHPIQQWKDQYILAAETYYPQFHTEAFTDYDFYGRPYTNSYSVFDGYRFTGVILASFDKDANLLWDNALQFRNVLSHSLIPTVSLWFNDDEIILAYLSEGKIGSAILNQSDVVEPTSWSEPELLNPGDKLLAESKSAIAHWYDQYFLCYGYQEIRDITKGSGDKRLVYFCSKVVFER